MRQQVVNGYLPYLGRSETRPEIDGALIAPSNISFRERESRERPRITSGTTSIECNAFKRRAPWFRHR